MHTFLISPSFIKIKLKTKVAQNNFFNRHSLRSLKKIIFVFHTHI
jgi:hypothetical protein